MFLLSNKYSIARLVPGCLILLLSVSTYSQSPWQLKKDEEGIKVYTRGVEGSRIKEVKVTCTLDATLSELAALLMDAPAHEKWVYNTRESHVVRQVNEQHQVYYSETKLPWPMNNRDAVVDLVISQNAATKTLVVTSNTVQGLVPEKKGIVRVPMSQVKWIVTPKTANSVEVDYIAQADPGGSVPAWIVNGFIAKGPFETFVKLRRLLKEGGYGQTQVAYIKN